MTRDLCTEAISHNITQYHTISHDVGLHMTRDLCTEATHDSRGHNLRRFYDGRWLWFLPCDAMHNAAIAGMRCPSVCPYACHVSCAKTTKVIFDIFSPSGSQAILVFPHQTGWRYSDWNPPNGGVECKGGMKNDDFRPIFHSISETVIVRWAHTARQFVSIEFSFHPYNI